MKNKITETKTVTEIFKISTTDKDGVKNRRWAKIREEICDRIDELPRYKWVNYI